MISKFLPVLLIVANVMGAGMIVPQVVRLHRRGIVEGVSGVWVGVGIAMNAWWIAYALHSQLWGIAPVSIAGLVLYSVIAWQYRAIVGLKALHSLGLGALLGLIPLPFLVFGGWSAAALAIGLSYGIQFSPAAISAVTSKQLEAVSPTTWTMAWIEAAIWFVYGITIDDPALLLGGIGGTLMASIILLQLRPSRQASLPMRGSIDASIQTGRRVHQGCVPR
ncbi:MAG: hypothetical protein V3V01_12390 [Acidimicrobiales bacterium]